MTWRQLGIRSLIFWQRRWKDQLKISSRAITNWRMSLISRIINPLLFAFCIQTYPEAAFENTTQLAPDRLFRLHEGTNKASSLTKLFPFENGCDDLDLKTFIFKTKENWNRKCKRSSFVNDIMCLRAILVDFRTQRVRNNRTESPLNQKCVRQHNYKWQLNVREKAL